MIQDRYVRGDASDEVLVDYVGSGTSSRRFLSADERGSIIALTDSAGALIGINRYDEYGKPQSGNIGRFQYTGQMWLPEAGVYDYKARAYLPHLGIFAQTDPIGSADSPNLYAYVLNDPINLTDPLGLQADDLGCVIPGRCPIVVTGTRDPHDFGPGAGSATGSIGNSSGGPGEHGGGDRDVAITHPPCPSGAHFSFGVCVPNNRMSSPLGPGLPYTGQTPKQQQTNCNTNPVTRAAIANRGWQNRANAALQLSFATGSAEYGWFSSVSGSQVRNYGLGTSGSNRGVALQDLNPTFGFLPVRWAISVLGIDLVSHTHIPDVALSADDVRQANEFHLSIIATTDEGRNYCYP